MSQLAIGMIETMGLAAGIEAADICLKSANINLVGYEFARGSGMTVVKIEGNVGAVKAAISAATAALGKLGKVHAQMVIPRPSDSIDMLIRNESTVGYETEKEEIPKVEQNEAPSDKEDDLNQEKADESEQKDETDEDINNQDLDEEQIIEDENNEVTEQDEATEESDENSDDTDQDSSEETSKSYTCNICKDPKCPRQKGDLRIYCIHYKENKEKNKDNKDK
ncbi:BMC domain-containing protein [Intestinibacter bartlettii]|uniref:BMC domain-containing protein n=1 Tax=Intestinibacter bartlettii TaxID=261299 RepID=A0ABS6DTQ6_9FIRM|nr:BMC domain-containing protein [Intestinibacter bartlettii]MBU5335067.1 BMC domain-containing protein [Intestinibacter bartlettii]